MTSHSKTSQLLKSIYIMVSLEKSIIVDSFPTYWNIQLQSWVMVSGSERIVLDFKINTQAKAHNFSKQAYSATIQSLA